MSKYWDALKLAENQRYLNSVAGTTALPEIRPSEQLTALTTAVNQLGLAVARIEEKLDRVERLKLEVGIYNSEVQSCWKHVLSKLDCLQAKTLLADFRRNLPAQAGERKVRREKPRRKAR